MDKDMIQLEYNNIKQEIFILMQRCDSLIITIYTISITLLGLGYEFENRYFFLLIIIFIVPMQGLVNVRRYHMARCSAYIKLCIESQIETLKWERMVGEIDSRFKSTYLKESRVLEVATYLIGIGTIIISLVAMIHYVQSCLTISQGVIQCSIIDIGGIVISVILFIILIFLSKDYIDYVRIHGNYQAIIKDILDNEEDSENNETINYHASI